MKDTYIDGIAKSGLDDEITRIVKKAKRRELGGSEMVTAIQNEDGVIYRVICVDGLGAYMYLAMEITGIGLVDLHAENLNPGKYDSLFIFKK
ncbi:MULTISPECIES: hypothetical protein [Lonsdalea]|uniref:Uncharacterized protein n=2 Tax=Lonsdalea TaxID=1082702 RepID=A0ACD1J9Y3_9GAMM|nr:MULTISPECIES: hypothetical protein [Lonsdalea]OSM94660.1 hypothetical protein AU499_16120 [Lonsdalea populi]QPQ23754.1 hypothetical protein I6N93_14315 [Lonsdalea populi]RAT11947.1 hypothetical protein AU485_13085 [Lonsdalea quercina]RAT19788.1 hypothetical protein AU487_10125 [Lonsdalea populi]RAT20533.1 hypothetical protein AU488_14065 [Lonsdalea populi]